jgi:DNA-binding transcriptional LysR family regulator
MVLRQFDVRGEQISGDETRSSARGPASRLGSLSTRRERALRPCQNQCRAAAAAGSLPILFLKPESREDELMSEDWCPPIPGLFLYYPGHRHVPATLRAFIEVLREVLP